jgi:integrase
LLQFLQDQGWLDANSQLGHQVTPDVIELYLERARGSWSSVTLYHNVFKLRRVAEIIEPGLDLAWLKEIEADLRALVQPLDRSDRFVMSDRLVQAGLALVEQAEKSINLKPAKRARLYRNGLMIALLALCPIRLKNFTGLTLGTSFRRIGHRWWILLAAEETKTGRPDERRVPTLLEPVLNGYLKAHRQVLLGDLSVPDAALLTGPLWVNDAGKQLSYSGVGLAILTTTRQRVGVAVNPHAFRMAAATTAAYRVPAEPHLGSALLQHTDSRVTEEHYTRVSSIKAVLNFGEIISKLTN